MTPAERTRLCAALKRATGRTWRETPFGTVSVRSDPFHLWRGRDLKPWPEARLHRLNAGGSVTDLSEHASGRGWPERLARAVAAEISRMEGDA